MLGACLIDDEAGLQKICLRSTDDSNAKGLIVELLARADHS